MITKLGLQEIVELAPLVPYRTALAEMMTVDGLLIFQGYTSNPAIPAKLYEYLRAQRPILALVDAEGDTAALLDRLQVGTVLPIENSEVIKKGLEIFLRDLNAGAGAILSAEAYKEFDRARGAMALAKTLDTLTANQRICV